MVSDDEFQELILKALASLPGPHAKNIKNVELLFSDEPTDAQREQLKLRNDQTLLGLYEGIPLTQRQGQSTTLPDKITLFKLPLMSQSHNEVELFNKIRHTLWHEIAHYYGLNHDQISRLDRKL